MINMVEKLFNIASPNKTPIIAGQEFLSSFNRTRQTLALSARPNIGNKGFVVN